MLNDLNSVRPFVLLTLTHTGFVPRDGMILNRSERLQPSRLFKTITPTLQLISTRADIVRVGYSKEFL